MEQPAPYQIWMQYATQNKLISWLSIVEEERSVLADKKENAVRKSEKVVNSC